MKIAPATEVLFRASVLALITNSALTLLAGPGFSQAIPDIDPSKLTQPSAQASDTPERKMAPCLTTLAKAGRLEDISLKSGKLKESVAEILKLGAKAKDDLNWIIENGSPCGRMYAALILKRLDAAAGAQAITALNAGMGNINLEYVSAGERCHYSVGDVVVDQGSAHPLIQLIPTLHYQPQSR